MAYTGNESRCRADTLVGAQDNISSYYDNERAGGHYELIVIVADPSVEHSEDNDALLVSDPVTVDLDSGVAPVPTS